MARQRLPSYVRPESGFNLDLRALAAFSSRENRCAVPVACREGQVGFGSGMMVMMLVLAGLFTALGACTMNTACVNPTKSGLFYL